MNYCSRGAPEGLAAHQPPAMRASGGESHLLGLLQQSRHLELAVFVHELWMRLELRIRSQERMAVLQHQTYENLTYEASSDRTQMDRCFVFLELLLRFGQHVVPKGRVPCEAGRDIGNLLVGWGVAFVGFSDFQLVLLDWIQSHGHCHSLARRQLHSPAAQQVAFRER